jgi:hypothetical protein
MPLLLREQLLALASEQRSRKKAEWLAGVASGAIAQKKGSYTYTDGDLTITVSKAGLNAAGNLSLWVTATRAGAELVFDHDFELVNPPLGLRQADGSMTENPLQALKKAVAGIVRQVAR